ncbi:hypothetical protein NA57DRAFT_70209 [Rhizodiscina lignyota]|uniref:Uncharacterized protein n=1 Tax=Rhizodiscina lignyota TaxID=1504668 RepID=A0A9P4IT54_9PEZI|nr:hypothetical protein NA57DRAFT_70209 [Rhizodiscina lignyota]
MADEKASAKQPPLRKPKKLQTLPKNAKIQKRPLLRPPIPSPRASSSQQKVVYVSTRTPFMSAVKRVRKLLVLADRRAVQSKLHKMDAPPKDKIMAAATATLDRSEQEEVWIKATGRSIEKALGLAVWFQGQDEYKVRMQTGSVWAVDDVVVQPKAQVMDEVGEAETEAKKEEEEDIPDTRLRQTSLLEVAISLR